MNKPLIYALQCLAASGIAVMNSSIAWKLRPDLWASGQDCALGFNRLLTIPGARRYVAILMDGMVGEVIVLARSDDMLEKRLEWLTGHKVEKLFDYVEPTHTEPPAMNTTQVAHLERLNRLRKLANMTLPAHDCALRKDILAARTDLKRMDA